MQEGKKNASQMHMQNKCKTNIFVVLSNNYKYMNEKSKKKILNTKKKKNTNSLINRELSS